MANGEPSAVARFQDIHGLDAIPWWPLALGWWGLLGGLAALLAGVVIVGWLRQLWIRRRRWRREAYQELNRIRHGLKERPAKESAAALNALLRRIALRQCGRTPVASLTDMAWLTWLEAHDPHGFPWRSRGVALIRLPYAPPAESPASDELRRLTRVTRAWIDAQGLPGCAGGRGSLRRRLRRWRRSHRPGGLVHG
jgi:hypothetical protein